jgi:polysaccharide chain length determinant protein (PEP-CTERM system associated)
MNGTGDFDFARLLAIFYRRKTLVACAFSVVFLLSGYASFILPNVYRSSSLILVTPQRVPSSYVTSTVTMDLLERTQTSIQEILSRTQLGKMVEDFNLYPGSKNSSLDERVERLRKAIKIEMRRNNVFQLSFESTNPEKALQVTSRIVSLFIDQNLNVREQQAIGTKTFISAEADRLRKELEEQETIINQYKAANRYELPDQLDTNLRSLEQLRREIEGRNQRVAALQERKGVLQKQLVESDIFSSDLLGGTLAAPAESGPQNFQLQMRKKELSALLQRYSDKHPDVVRLRKEIQDLEAASKENADSKPAALPASNSNPIKQVLQSQIADIEAEIQALRSQNERIRSQAGVIQSRIDNTPMRSIELSKISRGYEITLRKYQDLLAKALESELSENMEKKQKGEQFQILDPPNFPLAPVRPNRPLILLLGLLAGVGAGFGLAFAWENFDTSFKGGDEVKTYVNVPLLATIPALSTRGNVVEQRRSQSLLLLGSLGALAIGIVFVRTFAPMFF